MDNKTKVFTVRELIKELNEFDKDKVVVFRLGKVLDDDNAVDYDEVFLIDQYSDGSLIIDISTVEYIK